MLLDLQVEVAGVVGGGPGGAGGQEGGGDAAAAVLGAAGQAFTASRSISRTESATTLPGTLRA